MAAPAIAQPIPIPVAPPLETPEFLGVVLEVGLEVGFDPTLVVRVLDVVGDDKGESDAVLGFVVEGAITEVPSMVTDAVFELGPVARAGSSRVVVADTSVLPEVVATTIDGGVEATYENSLSG